MCIMTEIKYSKSGHSKTQFQVEDASGNKSVLKHREKQGQKFSYWVKRFMQQPPPNPNIYVIEINRRKRQRMGKKSICDDIKSENVIDR